MTYFEVFEKDFEKDLIALLPTQRTKGLVYSCRAQVRRAKKLCVQITAEITLRRLRLSLGQARLQKVEQCKCKDQACQPVLIGCRGKSQRSHTSVPYGTLRTFISVLN